MFSRLFDYPGIFWRPRAALALLVVTLSVFIWGPIVLAAITLRVSHEWVVWALRSWNVWVARVCGIHFDIHGREYHDPTRASLVVANHQSLFDIPAAFASLGGDLRMVAKKELFDIPVFGHCIRAAGFISVDRGNRNSGHEVTKQMANLATSGAHIWIAPEGTRAADGVLKDFKKGSFGVALDNKLPIQPIVVLGSWRALPKGSLLPRPGTVIRVEVLPRLEPADYADIKDRGALAKRVRERIAEVVARAS